MAAGRRAAVCRGSRAIGAASKRLRRAVRAAAEFGLDYLTVYSFSAENWSRPVEEISDLMGLLKHFIREDLKELYKSGVKIKVIGSRDNLKPDILALLDEAETLTSANTGLTLVVAFNYGSRQEIAAAARLIAYKVAAGLSIPRPWTRRCSNSISTPLAFPIPISSSGHRASRDCPIS